MDMHQHHEELISGISTQMKEILDSSDQAIYIYLDDVHKICNKKFASLLGYESPEEWAHSEVNFAEIFVDDNSARTLVSAYRNAMEKYTGSSFRLTWRKKSGATVDTNVILVPIAFNGHNFALHFIQ